MSNVICIVSGPTASGKTSISIELAKRFGGEVVNFDSLLFYKELNIGTAKPNEQEKQNIVHHMVDTHSIKSAINAADYIKLALPIIKKLHQENKIVYLVGGSGFYLQALLYGMFPSTTSPQEIIEKSDKLYYENGIEPFLDVLKENDLESFDKYHSNDHYRIRRAVEHFWTTGQPFSSSREQMKTKKLTGPMFDLNWNVFHIYLDLDKEDHWQLIQKRTNLMLTNGLLDEVSNLLSIGFSGNEKPLMSIGYKESQDYLAKKLNSLEELSDKISIATRQLAKSQRTWFKKQQKNQYNPLMDKEKIMLDFETFLAKVRN